jgi:hypothetical protein
VVGVGGNTQLSLPTGEPITAILPGRLVQVVCFVHVGGSIPSPGSSCGLGARVYLDGIVGAEHELTDCCR